MSGDEEVSDKVALISADFEEHGEAIATASDILTSTYPNGLTAGEIIELTQDADIGWSQLPSGTRLRIEHGDSDFPEVLYASTEKWPTGKGRNHHLRFVMLDTKELGQSYRRHTGTTRKREQDEMRRQRGMRERILSGAREVSAAALEG